MRGLLIAAATLLAVAAPPAAAQEPWKASYYPYWVKGPNDATSLVLHYQFAQAADYEDRVAFARSLSVEAGINASGSRFGVARFKAPRLADGWRLFAQAGLNRENRFGFFGTGNDTEEASDDLLALNPWYDRVRRSRAFARVDLTRRIAGPLHVAVGASVTTQQFGALPGGTRYQDLYFTIPPCLPPGPCPAPAGSPEQDYAAARVQLVVDTRDNENVPSRGVLLETGAEFGSGDDGYTGVYASASGYVPPWYGAVIAGRVLYRSLEADAPLDARWSLEAWERSIPLLGGPESHRSFVYGRYTGRKVFLANAEFRQDILNFGDFGAITGLAFLDAGMVQELETESNDLHLGGGLGLALRILRSTVLQFNFAVGGDGYRFSMGTGWAF